VAELQPFSGLKARCVKCRCVEISIRHCVGQWPERITFFGAYCARSDPATGEAVEHFHRACKACGYEWMEVVPAPQEGD
jgi:hypothetical protein